MKISEAIGYVKEVKPNSYSDEMILNWINELEAKVHAEVFKELPEGFTPYTLPEDLKTELKMPKPYDNCYVLYAEAMIDFNQGEIGTYNNTMALFTVKFNDACEYYVRRLTSENPLKIKAYL